jgi:predicted MFS family arabinose efflux permease
MGRSEDARHTWQQVAIIVCRSSAATTVGIALVASADTWFNWKVIIGAIAVVAAIFDLVNRMGDI